MRARDLFTARIRYTEQILHASPADLDDFRSSVTERLRPALGERVRDLPFVYPSESAARVDYELTVEESLRLGFDATEIAARLRVAGERATIRDLVNLLEDARLRLDGEPVQRSALR